MVDLLTEGHLAAIRRLRQILTVLVGAAGLGLLLQWAPIGRHDDAAELPPARPVADGPDQSEPATPDYRRAIGRRRLFVLPTPTADALGIDDAIAKAREKVAFRGVVDMDGRMGAYFEVGQGDGAVLGLYYEGDRVADFTVTSVESQGAVLEVGGHEVRFSF